MTETAAQLLPHAAAREGLREPTGVHLVLTGPGGGTWDTADVLPDGTRRRPSVPISPLSQRTNLGSSRRGRPEVPQLVAYVSKQTGLSQAKLSTALRPRRGRHAFGWQPYGPLCWQCHPRLEFAESGPGARGQNQSRIASIADRDRLVNA